MIVWGGFVAFGSRAQGAIYDPAADRWTPVGTAGSPEPRGGHLALWTGSRMIVFGGSAAVRAVDVYDPIADRWVQMTVAGTGAAAVWTGSRLIMAAGGFGIYDPATDTWSGARRGRVIGQSDSAVV